MAAADYWLCDICERKTFYDANLDWDYARELESYRDDGRLIPAHTGDMMAICIECAKTHRVVIKPK